VIDIRRFLVVFAFAAWQGGFFFYATFVVPVGTEVLDSAKLQGAITQKVSMVLNYLGVVSLIIFAIDQKLGKAPGSYLQAELGTARTVSGSYLQAELGTARTALIRWRWSTWLVMAMLHAALFILHSQLSLLFDPKELVYANADRARFKFWHGVYLWIVAAQWLIALVYLGSTIRAWRLNSERQETMPA
jgi:hypothetical protein